MLTKKDIASIERRAAAARVTMTEVCKEAGTFLSSWSRAKSRGRIRPSLLKSIESALARIEARG